MQQLRVCGSVSVHAQIVSLVAGRIRVWGRCFKQSWRLCCLFLQIKNLTMVSKYDLHSCLITYLLCAIVFRSSSSRDPRIRSWLLPPSPQVPNIASNFLWGHSLRLAPTPAPTPSSLAVSALVHITGSIWGSGKYRGGLGGSCTQEVYFTLRMHWGKKYLAFRSTLITLHYLFFKKIYKNCGHKDLWSSMAK